MRGARRDAGRRPHGGDRGAAARHRVGRHARRGGEGPAGDDGRRARRRRAAPDQGRAARGRGDPRARARRRGAAPRCSRGRGRARARAPARPGISVCPRHGSPARRRACTRCTTPRRAASRRRAGRSPRPPAWAARGPRAHSRAERGARALRGVRARPARRHRVGGAPARGRCGRRRRASSPRAAARASTAPPSAASPRHRRASRSPPAAWRGRCRLRRRTRSPKSSRKLNRRRDDDMPQIGYAHRQAPMGRDGMVASCHPLASLAGVEVMRSGGNVVDAAIATNAVLGVTQPNYCGVGGDLFCLYYEAADAQGALPERARAARAPAPRSTSCAPGPGRACRSYGPGSVSVPGVTRAWRMLLEEFGTRPLAEPARAGRALCAARLSASATSSARRSGSARPAIDDPEWRRVFIPGGEFPTAGQCFRQPELARALSDLGDDPELFYRGWVARAIADRLAADGFLTAGRPGRAHWRVGRADLDHVPRLHRLRDAAADPGVAALLTPQPARGLRPGAIPVHSVEHLHLLHRDDQDRVRRPRPLGRRPRARALAGRSGSSTRSTRRERRPRSTRTRRSAISAATSDGDTTGFVVADGRATC